MVQPTGELSLTIERRGQRGFERSVVSRQRHAGALRVLRALYPDSPRQVSLMTVNPGGGYLGGDRYELEVHLEAGAELLLTTQAATKIYRSSSAPACSRQRFTLERGARLEFVPDSLIAYRGASYRQLTEVSMHPEASLALAEVVSHGWSPDGTPFAFDELSLRTRVVCEDRPLVTDALLLRPTSGGAGPLMLGGFSHLATLLVVDSRATGGAVEELRELLGIRSPRTGDRDPLIGITGLRRPGFMLRALTDSTPAAEGILRMAIDWMREHWHDQSALALRKL